METVIGSILSACGPQPTARNREGAPACCNQVWQADTERLPKQFARLDAGLLIFSVSVIQSPSRIGRMAEWVIEQATYRSQERDAGFLGRSPGFEENWLAEAERLC